MEQQDLAQAQVAYADTTAQYLVAVVLTPNMTARQVLQTSGLLEKLPEDMPLIVGVYGHKLEDLDAYLVQAGDRLEIYRPLTRDPMLVRRKRAEAYPVGRLKRKLR